MAQVISATTKFVEGATARAGREAAKAAGTRANTNAGAAKRFRFLAQAEELLGKARGYAAEGRMDQALEMAYQAGLRTAGARVAMSAVAQRKRKPSSAWEQLALVDAASKEWAKDFSQYSRLRSRLASGLEDSVEDAVVFAVMDLAARFLDDVQADMCFGAHAA